MKKYLFVISIICVSAFQISCQSADSVMVEELENNNQPEVILSLAEKENINDFCSEWNQLNSLLVKVSKESETRSGNEQDPIYTEEIEAIHKSIENAGGAAQKMFVSMGVSQEEMNNICPSDQSLVYAVAGLEVVNAIDDPAIGILGPQEYEVMSFDKEKALHCLGEIFNIDWFDVAVDITIAYYSGQKISKEMLLKVTEKAIKETAKKLGVYASGTAVGFVLMLAEWSACYFF